MTGRTTSRPAPGVRVRIGIHTSIAGRIALASERAHDLGCDGFQIFSSSPRSWAGSSINRVDAAEFRQRRHAFALDPLVIHVNYLVNLASPQPILRARSVQAFRGELERAVALGADYLVLHPGSASGTTRTEALRNVVESLRQTVGVARLDGLQVLLENTAGQGSVLGAEMEELAAMLDAAPELHLGACIDTAHLHGAGYELRTPDGLEETLAKIHITIGLGRVKVIHLNDSKVEFGSRVDRHQHIGKGTIGSKAIQRLLRHPALAGKSFILETPIDKPGDDKRNLQAARRLARTAPAEKSARKKTGKIVKKKARKPATKTRRKTVRKKTAKRR